MFSLLVSETFQKLNIVMVAEGHIAAASLRVRLIADINLGITQYYQVLPSNVHFPLVDSGLYLMHGWLCWVAR